jgi:glycine dehydrogenase subunit 2
MLNRQGRPTRPEATDATVVGTISGDWGLDHEEGLIFEIGRTDVTGVDLPDVAIEKDRLGGLRREGIGLPGLSEPEAMRHYVRLSQRNASIDASLYPLGSCTMKHNPRLNE